MNTNSQLERIASEFWAGTGLGDRYPRCIETAVALKLPLTLVKVPAVNVNAVRRWLLQRGLHATLPVEPRDLMGCLVAYRGFGVAFICGSDPAEEQRLTVAHETAHFLEDYLRPRRDLLATLGEGIADVLDGLRVATPAERANAILAHVRVGVHVHLMPRAVDDALVDAVEDRADRLGLELVAPRQRVLAVCREAAARTPIEIAAWLSLQFGLPGHAFASFLAPAPSRQVVPSFLADIRPAFAAAQSRHGKS